MSCLNLYVRMYLELRVRTSNDALVLMRNRAIKCIIQIYMGDRKLFSLSSGPNSWTHVIIFKSCDRPRSRIRVFIHYRVLKSLRDKFV